MPRRHVLLANPQSRVYYPSYCLRERATRNRRRHLLKLVCVAFTTYDGDKPHHSAAFEHHLDIQDPVSAGCVEGISGGTDPRVIQSIRVP